MRSNKNPSLVVLVWCCISATCILAQGQAQSQNEVVWLHSISSSKPIRGKVFTRILNGIIGTKDQGKLGHPISLVALNQDELRILDQQSKTIWSYKEATGELAQAVRSRIDFPSLVGMCSPDGKSLVFTDSYLEKVFRLSDKGKVSEFISDATTLKQPTGIAYNLITQQYWVVETAAHRITVFSKNGEFIKRIGVRGTGPLEFNFPTFIWIDADGLIYMVDSMNFRVQILNPDGSFLSEFGEVGDGTGYFTRPKGIATDSYGHIYVVDGLFNTVQIFDREGSFLHHFGSGGSEEDQLSMPTNIYIDKNDNIFVADTYNSRVQVFKLMMNEQN